MCDNCGNLLRQVASALKIPEGIFKAIGDRRKAKAVWRVEPSFSECKRTVIIKLTFDFQGSLDSLDSISRLSSFAFRL